MLMRDFTDDMEQKLLDVCEEHEKDSSWTPVNQFGTIKIEEYDKNQSDILYHMNNLEVHHAMYLHGQSYNKEWVQNVFDDVRLCDSTYSAKAESNLADALSYYKDSLIAILDSIRVNAPGEGSVSLERIEQMKVEYELNGEISGKYGSIFGASDNFTEQLSRVGDGAITPTYEKLYNGGNVNWDLVDDWMLNGADGWEIAAMSRLLDECYIETADGFDINFSLYEQFLSHCYIPDYLMANYMEVDLSYDDCSPLDEIPVDGFGCDKYNLSPTVVELFAYRQLQSNAALSQYGQGLFHGTNYTAEENKAIYDCFVTDSLLSLCINFQQLKQSEDVRGAQLFDLRFNDDGTGVYMSLHLPYDALWDGIFEHEYNDCYISLLNQEIEASWNDVYVEGEKYGIKDPDVVVFNSALNQLYSLLGDTLFDLGSSGAEKLNMDDLSMMIDFSSDAKSNISQGLDVFGLRQDYNNTIAENEKIMQDISLAQYKEELRVMGGNATFIQYGDNIVISNQVIDYDEMTEKIAYYNVRNDSELTVENLQQQIRDLSNGEHTAFYNTMVGEGGVAYDDYSRIAQNLLEDNSNATLEQIEDSFRQANDIYTYIENNYDVKDPCDYFIDHKEEIMDEVLGK